jgi:hypothetical protein
MVDALFDHDVGSPEGTHVPFEGRSDASIANEAAQLFGGASSVFSNIEQPIAAHMAQACQLKGYDGESVARLRDTLLADADRINKLGKQATAAHIGAAKDDDDLRDRFPDSEEINMRIKGILQGTFTLAQRMMILAPSELQDILDKDALFRPKIKLHGDPKRELYRRYVEEKISDAERKQGKKIRIDKAAMEIQANANKKTRQPFKRLISHISRGVINTVTK